MESRRAVRKKTGSKPASRVAQTGYLLANANAQAGARLAAIASLFDPATFRRMAACGLSPGWRCWEVGAGGRTVIEWMAREVGPTGRVLATDIDTRWMDAAPRAAIEVRRHDLIADKVPDERFDMVHARLVLVHIPQRKEALQKLVTALKPGGWLIVEDADAALQPLACLDPRTAAERRANRIRDGFRRLMAGRGVELAFGRTLPRLLREAGLRDVRAEGSFPIGGAAAGLLELATVRMLAPELIASGAASETDLAAHEDAVATGSIDLTIAPMIAAMGRAPA